MFVLCPLYTTLFSIAYTFCLFSVFILLSCFCYLLLYHISEYKAVSKFVISFFRYGLHISLSVLLSRYCQFLSFLRHYYLCSMFRFSMLLFCSSNKTKSLMTALSSFLLQIGIVGGRNLIVFVGTLLLCNTSLNMFLGRMILIIDFVIQSRILGEEEEKKGYLLLGKGTISTNMTLDHRNRLEEHTLSPQKKH